MPSKKNTNTSPANQSKTPAKDLAEPASATQPSSSQPFEDQQTREATTSSDGEFDEAHAKAVDASFDAEPSEVDVPANVERSHGELEHTRLVDRMVKELKVEFFKDQYGNRFAWLPVYSPQPHFETVPLDSPVFTAKVGTFASMLSHTTTPPSTINKAVELAKNLAIQGREWNLENRRCLDENGRILIDLGDASWSTVAVSENEVTLENATRPRFFRPRHLKELPHPTQEGDWAELFEHIEMRNEEDKLLTLTWTLAAMSPNVETPILVLRGTQGSAKTTRSQFLRSLIDASVTPVLGEIEMSDLFLTFQHHAVPCFENVSSFNRKIADMFCRAVTGNGVERRKLFTNSDQVLYSFKRPIIINGIDLPSMRPDFLDRCIVITCERMTNFRPKREVERRFNEARPRLFTTLLHLLSKTLKAYQTTEPTGEFRMADFAHFGRAVASAIGLPAENFDNAYRSKVRQCNEDVIEASPMTTALIALSRAHSVSHPWSGSASDLLSCLEDKAHTLSDKKAKSDIPKNPRWLSTRISELIAPLRTHGVFIEQQQRTSSRRSWQIYSSNELKPPTPEQEAAERDLTEEFPREDPKSE